MQWHEIDSGAQQATAMASGALDVGGVLNTTSVQMANAEGNPVIIIAGLYVYLFVFALVGQENGPKTFADLRGKTVAGPKGTVLHQLLVAGLAKEGMTIRDVKFVQMGIPQSFSALMSGKVDAALIAAGALVKAKQAGKPVIATATGLVTPILAMCASKKFIDEPIRISIDVVAVQDEATTGSWPTTTKPSPSEPKNKISPSPTPNSSTPGPTTINDSMKTISKASTTI